MISRHCVKSSISFAGIVAHTAADEGETLEREVVEWSSDGHLDDDLSILAIEIQ